MYGFITATKKKEEKTRDIIVYGLCAGRTTEKIMKCQNIKKCTVFQNNENLEAHIAATGFPYDILTGRKVYKRFSDARGTVLQPT